MRGVWKVQAATALLVTAQRVVSVSGQSSTARGVQSCVKTFDLAFSPCPCDAATLTFAMEGETTVAANTVNIALVLDASRSINATEWELEKNFAKDVVEAFASRNLFDNGGTASYVQFSNSANNEFNTSSEAEFYDYVDADLKFLGGTNIKAGIAAGRAMLAGNSASGNFMVVVTDGEYTVGGDPALEADEARAEGTTIFAVGVGNDISKETLLSIGGAADNVFDIEGFEQIDQALEDILETSGGSVVPCRATGVSVTVDFNAPVRSVSYPGATVSGSSVTFTIADLMTNPTQLDASLDTCAVPDGTAAVASVDYMDDEGNTPDLSSLLPGNAFLETGCDDPIVTPAPMTPAPQPAPQEVMPTVTRAPTTPADTPAPATEPPLLGGGNNDCSVCSNLTPAQEEALASYDNGGKRVVCDPTCVDGVSDPSHCNYFGLGQICRGCGNCSVCTPCP